MTEIWRRVVSVPAKSDSNYYEVSSEGAIRHTVGDRVIQLKPTVYRQKNGTIINTSLNLYRKRISLHREVYLAFIGEIPKGYAVVHRDMNKKNNSARNLKLVRCKDLAKVYGHRSSARKELKTVVRINTKGEYVAFYRGLHEAARNSNVSVRSVRQRCMGMVNDVWISDGTTFVYEDDAENFIAKMC